MAKAAPPPQGQNSIKRFVMLVLYLLTLPIRFALWLFRGLWAMVQMVFTAVTFVASLFSALVLLGIISALYIFNQGDQSALSFEKPVEKQEKIVLTLTPGDISSEVGNSRGVLKKLMEEDHGIPFYTLLKVLKKAQKSEDVAGILLRFEGDRLSVARVQELTQALRQFKESGKAVVALVQRMDGLSSYALAQVADRLYVEPGAFVNPEAPVVESLYYKKLMDAYGVKFKVFQREEYKSYYNFLTQEKMTAAEQENVKLLLASLTDQMKELVEARGRLNKDAWEDTLLFKGPLVTSQAVAKNLFDREVVDIETIVQKTLKTETDLKSLKEVEKIRFMAPDVYLNGYKENFLNTLSHRLDEVRGNVTGQKKILLIPVEGLIADGIVREGGTGVDALIQKLERLTKKGNVKGIVLRINSGGGHAPAGHRLYAYLKDLSIRRGIQIFASFSEVAASAGYMVGCSAKKIYSLPGTLTGSIGVLAGALDLSEVLARNDIQVSKVSNREKDEPLFSVASGFSPKRQAAFEAWIDDEYSRFKKIVSEARGIPMEEMETRAKGRAFTGVQAKDLGLVDSLGTLTDVIRELREHIRDEGEKPEDIEVVPLHEMSSYSLQFRLLNPANAVMDAKAEWLDLYKTLKRPAAWAYTPLSIK